MILKWQAISNNETVLSSVNHVLIKETNKIVESSCSVSNINFIDQDTNWIQINGSLKPQTFQPELLRNQDKNLKVNA